MKALSKRKNYVHYLVALAIGIVIAVVLKPNNGLSVYGVRIIAILIPVLYLWLTVNIHWTSLLALGLVVLVTCAPIAADSAMTANEVWAGSMGHFVVLTVLVYMVLNVCLKETGVIDKIAFWFISRKFVQGRPYAFMAMFFASNVIIGLFMDNMSLAVIYIGITEVLCKSMGLKKGDPFYTCMFAGVMWGNVILSIASPIAHTLPLIIMGLAESQLGITITFAQWLMVGIPFTGVMWGVIMLVARIWHPDTSAFKNFDVEKIRRESKPLGKDGRIATLVFILVIFFVLAPSFFKNVSPFFSYLNNAGVAIPAICAVVALAVIQINGKPILNVPKAMSQVPWPPLIFAGTVSLFASPLSSEVFGINVWLGNILTPMVTGMSSILIIIILMALALVMTNFLSNTVTMTIFFNIGVILLATTGNVNMAAFTIIIALVSSMATVTPTASVPAPFFFGPEHVTMKNTIRYSIPFAVCSFFVCLMFLPFASAVI